MYWYTVMFTGLTPVGGDVTFKAVKIVLDNPWPVTVTRRIAESPPTFMVRLTGSPVALAEGTGYSASLPSPFTAGNGNGAGENVNVRPGETVGFGERVGEMEGLIEGSGENVGIGVCVDVGVKVGSGVRVGKNEGVLVGSGENVGRKVSVAVGMSVGSGILVGSGIRVGPGVEVTVGSGVRIVVYGVVISGAITVINPEWLSVLDRLNVFTVRFTV